MWRRIAVLIGSALITSSLSAQDTKFEPPKCGWPFNETPVRQKFDDQCNQGKTNDSSTIVQNAAKNNFCATGTPIIIDVPTLKNLQTEVESPNVLGPQYKPPTDRAKLRNLTTKAPDGSALGEGLLVQMVTFIFEAHYSDVESGESVNCKLAGSENNDIHVALVASSKETDECQSVTTEITPHFRPVVWTDTALNNLKGKPVRITGQLFFDASHHPGPGDTCQPPKRQSSWEIHPLYKLEVCIKDTLEQCKANDNTPGLWLSLSEYTKTKPDAAKKKEEESKAAATPPGQSQWESTLAYPYAKGDGALKVRYKGELVTLKVDEKTLGPETVEDLTNFSQGDTVWLRVSADRTSLAKVDCVPVPGGERLLALAIPAATLILFTLLLSWGGALHFLMGVDGHYSKSKFQLAVWFGALVSIYLATYCLRWRYGAGFGGISIPAHLALISGISAFTFAAAKSIAVTKKGADGAAAGVASAKTPQGDVVPPVPPQPVAPPKGAAQQWKFIRDLLTDSSGNAELGDYQMLVILLIAVGTYLFQAYHFLGTITFAEVKLPDVDSTILAAFGLGQGAYLGNKVASDGIPAAGKPPEKT